MPPSKSLERARNTRRMKKISLTMKIWEMETGKRLLSRKQQQNAQLSDER